MFVKVKSALRLTNLWDYEKYGRMARHGDFYYYDYNSGLQNQRYVPWIPLRNAKLLPSVRHAELAHFGMRRCSS